MNAGSESVRYNGPPQSPRKAGRKRRVAGWSLAMAGIVVAALWAVSGWRMISWSHRTVSAEVSDGQFSLTKENRLTFDPTPTWRLRNIARTAPLWTWTSGRWNVSSIHWWDVGIASLHSVKPRYKLDAVLWPIPLLLWTPAALLLRSGIVARRRAQSGKCKACGYDLAGLPPGADARCPECGTVLSGAKRMKAGSEAERSNGPSQ